MSEKISTALDEALNSAAKRMAREVDKSILETVLYSKLVEPPKPTGATVFRDRYGVRLERGDLIVYAGMSGRASKAFKGEITGFTPKMVRVKVWIYGDNLPKSERTVSPDKLVVVNGLTLGAGSI